MAARLCVSAGGKSNGSPSLSQRPGRRKRRATIRGSVTLLLRGELAQTVHVVRYILVRRRCDTTHRFHSCRFPAPPDVRKRSCAAGQVGTDSAGPDPRNPVSFPSPRARDSHRTLLHRPVFPRKCRGLPIGGPSESRARIWSNGVIN